ncbi:MAG: hypothetical protein CL927_13820 [Deltaproteobacteria bacterium]|nr:hypothetical protein [Deltaproteobacteria bacterium]HCH65337.1 hypothetical protein [Deltaproteobacteria bacterium]
MKSTLVTMTTLALLVAGPALAGKKKKDKSPPPSESAPAAAVPTTPDDAASKKFGGKLLKSTLRNFSPADTGGAKFKYDAMTFAADNTWKAEAWVEFDEEKMECIESGKWTMEPAESDKVATVQWTVDKTDCAGRDAGAEVRAQLTLSKDGSIDAKFR